MSCRLCIYCTTFTPTSLLLIGTQNTPQWLSDYAKHAGDRECECLFSWSRDVSPVIWWRMSLIRKTPYVLCLSVTSSIKCLLCCRSAYSTGCSQLWKRTNFMLKFKFQYRCSKRKPSSHLLGRHHVGWLSKFSLFGPFIACRDNVIMF